MDIIITSITCMCTHYNGAAGKYGCGCVVFPCPGDKSGTDIKSKHL